MLLVLIALVVVPVAAEALRSFDVPRKLAFANSLSELEALREEIESAPHDVDAFGEARRVGSFLVSYASRDVRGGVYFDLTTHSGFFGTDQDWRYVGFAYQPNPCGVPFEDDGYDYETIPISGDWHAFYYQKGGR